MARAALSGGLELPVLDGDCAAIGLACYTSGLGPLLGWRLERRLLAAGPTVAPLLELHLRHNRLRAARMEAAAVGLTDLLLEHGVAVAVLKGAHTARAYFPEPGARPASDVDLLVAANDTAAAEAVMQSAGFRLQSRGLWESSWRELSSPSEPRSLMLVHADDPWSVDLHASLNICIGAGARLADLDAAQPLSSRRLWPTHPGAMALEQPLLLLHLAAHAGAGLQNLTLLRLVELALVIRQDLAAGTLSWDAFLEMGERTGALGYAYPALGLCEDLAPGVVPSFVLERCAEHAPAGVVRLVRKLTPASAQRVDRSSVAEHFMWASGWRGRAHQLASDLVAGAGSWAQFWSIYETRAWRVIRGRLSR